MQLRTLRLDATGGRGALPLALDSAQTLLLVFGAPGLMDRPGLLTDLTRAFPRSAVLGCSTAGEIFGTTGEGPVLVGFYSYGELSPVSGGNCDLHNQTMTLTTLRER